MERYSREDAAERAGVSPSYLDRLIELGLVQADGDDGISAGGVRRAILLLALDEAGVPLEGLAELTRRDEFSLDFIEVAGYEVFKELGTRSFAELSSQAGIPIEVLATVREVMGGTPPEPDDRMREDELAVIPWIELMLSVGVRPVVVERSLRVYGDTLRRASETEAEWWRTDIQDRLLAEGKTEREVAQFAHDFSPRLSEVNDKAVLAVYHAQQRLSWGANIVNAIAATLDRAGLHARDTRPPAMCFLDISGYTRLTQERGDAAAAELAEQVARLVQRAAVQRGGRPVKWLGDGVMLHFPDPGQGVLAALSMLEGVSEAGLPPAHVGLHAGRVIFQEGDYFGQTVNVASRIGDYARPGEVLVSREVVDGAGQPDGVTFREIGPVELKGVSGVVHLYQALPDPPRG